MKGDSTLTRVLATIATRQEWRAVVDFDEVEHAVDVEVGDRGAASACEADVPCGIGDFAEGAVALPQEEIARVLLRVAFLIPDVAFRDEEIDEAVVVHVLELRVPARRRPRVAAGEGLRRVDAALGADVAIGRGD